MSDCKRGEIWLISFNPARGNEQSGIRPALIIQNDIGNKYSQTIIVSAISSKINKYPQNVLLNPSEKNGLTKESMVKLGQVLTLDKVRLRKKLGIISVQNLQKVDNALKLSLGLI